MYGYDQVDTANDGQQGLEAAEKKHYDLILMDLQMPVMDGFTSQKRIEASPLAGEPCVVALTANADVVSCHFSFISTYRAPCTLCRSTR